MCEYDAAIEKMKESLSGVDDLLNDFNREISDYLDNLSFEEETFNDTEERLDLINRLKQKYGNSIEEILEAKEEKSEELSELCNYEENRKGLEKSFREAEEKLKVLSASLTAERKKTAAAFASGVKEQLADLNFSKADFAVDFHETEDYTADGKDAVEFMISTNPGETRRALSRVVSGGELSRIMLGIKTLFAASDATETLIFDEIDAGISGRTAQKVAEKMALIGRSRQVLCITHLPQIAAMADTHYAITKELTGGAAVTHIEVLDDRESAEELARLIGGAEITENTLKSENEMKEMCRQYKKNVL